MSAERARLLALLRSGGRFLITSHVNPDGDSIASQCALRLVLARLGAAADIVNRDPVPRAYRFLEGADAVRRTRPRPWRAYAALIVLDCGDARRASGLLVPRPPVPVVNIDHHATNPAYGDLNWLRPSASSTSEIVHDLAVALRIAPRATLAEALYAGILTDTGSFRHGNATASAFRIAARLVRAGVDAAGVARRIFDTAEFETLRVLGAALAGLRRTPDGSIAWMTLPRRVLARLSSPAESEEWAAYPRSVATARLAVCFKETAPGQVRLSFRGKGDVDVAALAARWGGGGHRSAAGATAHGPLARVQREVIAAARRHLAAAAPRRTATRHQPARARALSGR